MSLTAVKSDPSAGIGVVGVGRAVARSDSREWAPPPPGKRCATVTMLLAQRIARNAGCWAVDEEPSYSANKMNVWQTLEYLSGLSLRKKYNYEGYADTHNVIRTLTPSWRRDSFAEKAKAEELTGGAVVGGATAAGVTKYSEERSSTAPLIAQDPALRISFQSSDNVALARSGSGFRRKHRSRNRKRTGPQLDPEYALSPEDLQDLVKCK